jgi:hypothetical protein
MTELFDTSGIRDDDAQWDALAARVAARALERHSSGRFGDSTASWVAASLLFAAALVIMIVSARTSPQQGVAEWRTALAPADDVGRAIAVRDAPPAIGALVLDPPEASR